MQQPLRKDNEAYLGATKLENEGASPQCRQRKQSMATPPKKNQQEHKGAGTRKRMKNTNAQRGRRKGSDDVRNVNNDTTEVRYLKFK